MPETPSWQVNELVISMIVAKVTIGMICSAVGSQWSLSAKPSGGQTGAVARTLK